MHVQNDIVGEVSQKVFEYIIVSVSYSSCLQVRTLVQRDFERALAAVDALISPVAPTAAYHLGQA